MTSGPMGSPIAFKQAMIQRAADALREQFESRTVIDYTVLANAALKAALPNEAAVRDLGVATTYTMKKVPEAT